MPILKHRSATHICNSSQNSLLSWHKDNRHHGYHGCCCSYCLSGLIFMDPCIVVRLSRNTNMMQLVIEFIIPKIYWGLDMFRVADRSSSGTLNCICSLWFIYPCGDRPLSRLSEKFPTQPWQHIEPSINFGIINSITSCILLVFLLFVGYLRGTRAPLSLLRHKSMPPPRYYCLLPEVHRPLAGQ